MQIKQTIRKGGIVGVQTLTFVMELLTFDLVG